MTPNRQQSALHVSTRQRSVFGRGERKFRRQAEGPDASLFGELAGGPSGGGHDSRPPPVRASCSLCLKQFPSSAAACFRQPLPLRFGQRRRHFSAPKPFSKVRLPAAFLQLSSVRRGPVFDRYGRRNRRGGEPVPGNGYSAAPIGQNRDSVPGNGYSAAPTGQNRDSVPGNGLLRARNRLKTCRHKRKTEPQAKNRGAGEKPRRGAAFAMRQNKRRGNSAYKNDARKEAGVASFGKLSFLASPLLIL